jgi:hypothetical protein
VQQTVQALTAYGFGDVETLETIYRPWHVQGQSVRPVQQMVGHTGFLTFARRLATPHADVHADSPLVADDAAFDPDSVADLPASPGAEPERP